MVLLQLREEIFANLASTCFTMERHPGSFTQICAIRVRCITSVSSGLNTEEEFWVQACKTPLLNISHNIVLVRETKHNVNTYHDSDSRFEIACFCQIYFNLILMSNRETCIIKRFGSSSISACSEH